MTILRQSSISSTAGIILSTSLLLGVAACKKKEGAEKAQPEAEAPKAAELAQESPPAEVPADPPATNDAANGDWLKVEARHNPPKPEDPVTVTFSAISVKSAKFDPANLEGGTASLEIDMSKIDSGIPKRDGHLASPDYFDVAKFATATVDVMDVKKTGDSAYSAQAKVNVHGVEQTWPVTFQVTGTGDDGSITIEAEQSFSRLDFQVGKAEAEEDSAAEQVKAMLHLTLKSE